MKNSFIQTTALLILLPFLASGIVGSSPSYAEGLVLPPAGTMVTMSSNVPSPILRGIKVNPQNPFDLDFIIDEGISPLTKQELNKETQRMVKYFLSILTIPRDDLWVNLSPYEKERVSTKELGITVTGRDLLAEDYLLKQLTSSLTHPETELGQEFWSTVYKKAQETYGNTQFKVNTFNKVWIVPDKAVVYQKDNSAFIVESHLRVMMEEDYTALKKNSQSASVEHALASKVTRDIILPQIEKEVNTGKNFAVLRQIYNAFILALWYKNTLKNSILNDVYVNQKKTVGVDVDDKNIKEKIYQQYLKAYKKGVYNLIKEDVDSGTQAVIPQKYFSGGVDLTKTDWSMVTPVKAIPQGTVGDHILSLAHIRLESKRPDLAMIASRYHEELHNAVDLIKTENLLQAAENLSQAIKAFFGDQLKIEPLNDRETIEKSLEVIKRYHDAQLELVLAKISEASATPEDVNGINLLVATRLVVEFLKAHQDLKALIAEKDELSNQQVSLEQLEATYGAVETEIGTKIEELEINKLTLLADKRTMELSIAGVQQKLDQTFALSKAAKVQIMKDAFQKQIDAFQLDIAAKRAALADKEREITAIAGKITQAQSERQAVQDELQERRQQIEVNAQQRIQELQGEIRKSKEVLGPKLNEVTTVLGDREMAQEMPSEASVILVPQEVDDVQAFRRFLRSRREELNFTPAELASRLDIHIREVYRLENPAFMNFPRKDRAKDIARVLMINEESFLAKIEGLRRGGKSFEIPKNDTLNQADVLGALEIILDEQRGKEDLLPDALYSRLIAYLVDLTTFNEDQIKAFLKREMEIDLTPKGKFTLIGVQGGVQESLSMRLLQDLTRDDIGFEILEGKVNGKIADDQLDNYVTGSIVKKRNVESKYVKAALVNLGYKTNGDFLAQYNDLNSSTPQVPQADVAPRNNGTKKEGNGNSEDRLGNDEKYKQLHLLIDRELGKLGQGHPLQNEGEDSIKGIFQSKIFKDAIIDYTENNGGAEAILKKAVALAPGVGSYEGSHERIGNESKKRLALFILYIIVKDKGNSGIRKKFLELYPNYKNSNLNPVPIPLPQIETLDPTVRDYLENLWIVFGRENFLDFFKDGPAKVSYDKLNKVYTQLRISERTRTLGAYNALKVKGVLSIVATKDDLRIFKGNKGIIDNAMNAGVVHKNTGGIDLNENMLDMRLQGEAITIHTDRAMLSNARIVGFYPVVIKVTPIPNIYLFLGVHPN